MLKRRRTMEAEDFDLEILKISENRFRASVGDPDGRGEAHWEFEAFRTQEGPRKLAAGCRDLTAPGLPVGDTTLDKGRSLFQTVFGGDVLAFWTQRLLEAQRRGRALRLRLRLDPEAWSWPWELLCDAKMDFLAVNPETPVVRYIRMAARISPLQVRLPLRILAVTASPSGLAPLDTEDELGDLEKSLEPLRQAGWVELETLRGATGEKLHRVLGDGGFHVLHFIGHGAYDFDNRQGVIYLEDRNGLPDAMNGQQLGVLLQGRPRLRLVVLNACNSARGSGADPFSSLVQSLVKARLPAVVAMQSAITDRAAITFARYFYESLARREPVDRAVAEARQAMLALGAGEWGSPVLAMRAPDGMIIVPPWWESLFDLLMQWGSHWRRWLYSLLFLVLLFIGLRSLARRWIDPNRLYSYLNPPDCPSPEGLPLAFVKVNAGVGKPSFCMSRFEATQLLLRKTRKTIRTRRRGDALPAVRVSWYDCLEILAALEKKSPGSHYRLPSRAEWEAAAGAGLYLKSSQETANCQNKEANDGFEGIAPVGSFSSNLWDLYDMAGNAAEWGRESVGDEKIVRGGSFGNVLRNCSARYWTSAKPEIRREDIGFRIVRDPIPTQ